MIATHENGAKPGCLFPIKATGCGAVGDGDDMKMCATLIQNLKPLPILGFVLSAQVIA